MRKYTRKNEFCHCGNRLPYKCKKYCSAACRPKQVYQPREKKVFHCIQCGVEMRSHLHKKFCSDRCSEHHKGRSKPLVFHSACLMCGVKMQPPKIKFCSDACCDKHHHKKEYERRKSKNVGPQKPLPVKDCLICKKQFQARSQNHLFCSHKCHLKNTRNKRRIKERGVPRPLHIRVKSRLSSRLRELLRRKGQQKQNAISAYMGCSPKEMMRHVESQFRDGMTWENYGVFGWHLDHIIPCARFDLTNEEHCKVCFNWRNIRPLWGEHNWMRQEMLTLDEALGLDPELVKMAQDAGVRLW